jgi:hypothetical protein
MLTVEEARSKAVEIIDRQSDFGIVMRSCWNCNSAHERLKLVEDAVIFCFDCGNYFFNGVDITTDGGELPCM